MNPAIRRLTRPAAVAIGLLAMVVIALTSQSGSVAKAALGDPGTITVHKTCSPTTAPGIFNLNLHSAISAGTFAWNGLNTNDDTLSPGIHCDETISYLVPPNTLAAAGALYNADVTLQETGLPSGVTASFPDGADDCDPSGLVDLSTVETTGVGCNITNTFDQVSLTINKLCLPVDAAGSFVLTIDTVAHGTVACGGTTGPVLVDVGTHTIGETAGTGTNLADFSMSMLCNDAPTTGSITIAMDTTCNILNAHIAASPTVTVSPTVTGTTTPGINNLLNNQNTNTNTSANTNTNTLTQSNTQTQTNDNKQNTNVNANPVQNVTVGGAKVDVSRPTANAGAPGGRPGDTIITTGPAGPAGNLGIRPPATGSAGLASTDSNGTPWGLVLVGAALAAGSLVAFRRYGVSKS